MGAPLVPRETPAPREDPHVAPSLDDLEAVPVELQLMDPGCTHQMSIQWQLLQRRGSVLIAIKLDIQPCRN